MWMRQFVRPLARPAVAACLLLAAVFACQRRDEPFVRLRVVVPRTRGSISVDGDIGEWDAAARVELAPGFARGPRDNEAVVKLLWDADNLYVAFVVFDTQLNAGGLVNDTELWQDDGVEVFVDSRHNASEVAQMSADEYERLGGSYEPSAGVREYLEEDDYHLIVNLRGTIAMFRGAGLRKMGGRWSGDIRFAVATRGTVNDNDDIDTQYTVEIAIPWKAMEVNPRPGLKLGADFAMNDVEPDGRFPSDWCGIRPFNQPDKWGEIVLGGGIWGGSNASRALRAVVAALAFAGIAGLAAIFGWRRWRPGMASPVAGTATAGNDAEYAAKLDEYISSNYACEDVSVKSAAKSLRISTRYLQAILKRSGKPSFTDILTQTRLREAERLLRTTLMSVGEICYAVGFRRPDAFATRFKRHTGFSPTEYRKVRP